MTPAEQLAAARSNVVGPYIPATEALLTDWCGPVAYRHDNVGVHLAAFVNGGWPGMFGLADLSRTSFDLRREEVRDHLIRRGAPAWARDVAPALWVWATMGRVQRRVMPKWVRFGAHHVRAGSPANSIASVCDTDGWAHGEDFGPETGPEGMACADVAALSRGCILEESDGWLLPLPDGGIGFWPKS